MLVASWSGIAMALGAAYRRGAASGTTALLAFAALLLDWAHRLWPPLERHRLAVALLLLQSRMNWSRAAHCQWRISWCSGRWPLTGFTVAYFIISQRDISR